MNEEKLRQFAIDLFKINAIKFGKFQTKIGLMTPVYCDLRVIVSFPKLLKILSELILDYCKTIPSFDIICGVPYTALPIATAVSISGNIPMVMRRKEAKSYGTKKLIEGVFPDNARCLIIEDVVTSGSSIMETVTDLRNSTINCTDAIVLLNRQQGGENFLQKNGIKMHALLNLTQLMNYLKEANCIDEVIVEQVRNYLTNTQVTSNDLTKDTRLKLSFKKRIDYAKNPITKKLFEIIEKKQTNLCVAADVTNSTELLNLAEKVGPHICLLKTHIDILEDFHENLIPHLKEIAERWNFILFEDRKFADIGQTVNLQFTKSIFQISSWASLVTAHSIMGQGTLDALKDCSNVGVFLLAEGSSVGCLSDHNYIQETLKLSKEYANLISGIVCQQALFLDEPGFIQLTPGCHLDSVKDHLGQQYSTPAMVMEKGADVVVVGRGIFKAADPREQAEKYKKALWEAYENRIA